MTDDRKANLRAAAIVGALGIVVLLCIAAAWAASDQRACMAEAQRQHLTARWSLRQGCEVQQADGAWRAAQVPAVQPTVGPGR